MCWWEPSRSILVAHFGEKTVFGSSSRVLVGAKSHQCFGGSRLFGRRVLVGDWSQCFRGSFWRRIRAVCDHCFQLQ